MILRKIDPLSLAKISGIFHAILGFVVGLLYSGFFFLMFVLGSALKESPLQISGFLLGTFFIIGFPFFYGLMGFVGALLSAYLYNWVAGKIGGIKLEFEEVEQVDIQKT